jgi:hypothetical protein
MATDDIVTQRSYAPPAGPNISTKAEAQLFIEKVEHYHPEQLLDDDDP